jgi:hypothetical protein
MTIPPNHVRKVGRDRRALRSALRPPSFPLFPLSALALSLLLATGCSTTSPRVLEVSSRTRLQDIDAADAREYYGYDQASRFRYEPQDLSIEAQREEFYVRWTPRGISLVKFEYRQVAKAATVFEKTYTPHGDMAKLFEVRGEEFRSGGSVSAWRVTLWKDDQLVAEKKSVLW